MDLIWKPIWYIWLDKIWELHLLSVKNGPEDPPFTDKEELEEKFLLNWLQDPYDIWG